MIWKTSAHACTQHESNLSCCTHAGAVAAADDDGGGGGDDGGVTLTIDIATLSGSDSRSV